MRGQRGGNTLHNGGQKKDQRRYRHGRGRASSAPQPPLAARKALVISNEHGEPKKRPWKHIWLVCVWLYVDERGESAPLHRLSIMSGLSTQRGVTKKSADHSGICQHGASSSCWRRRESVARTPSLSIATDVCVSVCCRTTHKHSAATAYSWKHSAQCYCAASWVLLACTCPLHPHGCCPWFPHPRSSASL